MRSYDFGSVSGAAVMFWFLTVIGVAIGAVVYALCAYPSVRRPQFRHWGASRSLGVLLGGALAAAVSAVAYGLCWTSFYRIELGGASMQLEYHFPGRTVVLQRDAVTGLQEGITGDKFNAHRLLVHAPGGKIYKSAGITTEHLREALQMARAWRRQEEGILP